MINNFSNIDQLLKEKLIRLFIIGFIIFIFILFFQPFPLEMLDYNDRLLYVTGFGIITFLISSVCYIAIPKIIPKSFDLTDWDTSPSIILNFLFFLLNATAFAFYIRYVGLVNLSIYIIFKIILVSLLPVFLMIIFIQYKAQEQIIENLQEKCRNYILKLREYQKSGEEKEIVISAGNREEDFKVRYKDIISIQSANNYIEIFYKKNDKIEKKVLRSTLKKIESLLLESQTILIRCHRTTIVNILHIEKLVRSYSGYSLKMKELDDLFPVSRQYLVNVRKSIASVK